MKPRHIALFVLAIVAVMWVSAAMRHHTEEQRAHSAACLRIGFSDLTWSRGVAYCTKVEGQATIFTRSPLERQE